MNLYTFLKEYVALLVDACELWNVRPTMAASPRSDDSGLAGSPFSTYDSSFPSSPASPLYSDQELCPNQNGNSDIVDSCVGGIESLQAESSNFSSFPSPESPSIVTQTKGVDGSTIQKLLHMLKTNNPSDETALISNLLINILSNSVKKTSALQSLPGSGSGKRRSDDCLDETVPKKMKEAPNCSQVQPRIVILEQPEKVKHSVN